MRDRERKSSNIPNWAVGGSTKQNNTVQNLADEMGDDVPSMEDFFLGDKSGKENRNKLNITQEGQSQLNQNFANTGNKQIRKSIILPIKNKRACSTVDSKAFDQKLIDRALQLLIDYQDEHRFALVKCQARCFHKGSATVQDDIMNKGIAVDAKPKQQLFNESSMMQS